MAWKQCGLDKKAGCTESSVQTHFGSTAHVSIRSLLASVTQGLLFYTSPLLHPVQVLVYNFGDLKLLHQIETLANPRGLVAISSIAESTVLATPGLHTGQVRGTAEEGD